jgi:AraC-like DNA-binding protein
VDNRHFDTQALRVLLQPASWKLASTFIPPDVRPARGISPSVIDRAAWHSHPSTDIMVVLRGNGRYGMDRRFYPARAGTVFFIGEGREHVAAYPAHTSALWISVLGNHALAWQADRDAGKASVRPATPIALRASDLGLNLGQCLAALQRPRLPDSLRRIRMLSMVEILAAGLVEHGYRRENERGRAATQRRAIRAIMQRIQDTAGKDVTLAALAHMSGYSPYHLHRLFKRHAGQTVHDYVNACRADRERALLKEGRSGKEIAAALGFSGPQAYSRWQRNRKASPDSPNR